jgi:hypothetical protein
MELMYSSRSVIKIMTSSSVGSAAEQPPLAQTVHHVTRSTNAMNRLRHFVVQPREKLSTSVIKDLILLNDPSLYCSERV